MKNSLEICIIKRHFSGRFILECIFKQFINVRLTSNKCTFHDFKSQSLELNAINLFSIFI